MASIVLKSGLGAGQRLHKFIDSDVSNRVLPVGEFGIACEAGFDGVEIYVHFLLKAIKTESQLPRVKGSLEVAVHDLEPFSAVAVEVGAGVETLRLVLVQHLVDSGYAAQVTGKSKSERDGSGVSV